MFNDIDKNTVVGLYNNNTINEPIEIVRQNVVLENKGRSQNANLVLTQEFLPKPHVKFDLELNDNNSFLLDIFSYKDLTVCISHTKIDIRAVQSNTSTGSIKAVAKSVPIVIGEDNHLVEVVFHIVNFVDYWDEQFNCSSDQNKRVAGKRLTLKNNDYLIVIESLEYTSELIKSLKATGGYAITHVGKITSLNNNCLTEKNINEILEKLYWFFSFLKGSWTSTILPVGYSSDKKKVWEQFENRTIESWRNNQSWFDPLKGKLLPGLFLSFSEKFSEDGWDGHLKTAIYWYINANSQSGGADGSIILIQAALERLSWAHYVNVTKSISSDGFSKLKAADQIRRLLTHANIPLVVPERLQNLSAFSKEFNFDGPEAFTYIRNRLVHPPKKREKKYNSKVLGECWVLSLWYLELAILKLLGYSGEYSNRINKKWAGVVEPVPWKNS